MKKHGKYFQSMVSLPKTTIEYCHVLPMYFRELIQGYSMETCAGNTAAYTNGYTVIPPCYAGCISNITRG